MPFFKRLSIILIIISILLVIMNGISYSAPKKIIIKDVEINDNNNLKYVSFSQQMSIDNEIREAIDKGIPLVFKVTLEGAELHDIWPTRIIKREVRYYQIQYKTLRKIYRVLDINNQKHEYKNMDDAIQKILKVDNLEFSLDKKNKDYELWINVALERKKLPKPLQVNYFDSTWNMTSERSIHKLGK